MTPFVISESLVLAPPAILAVRTYWRVWLKYIGDRMKFETGKIEKEEEMISQKKDFFLNLICNLDSRTCTTRTGKHNK